MVYSGNKTVAAAGTPEPLTATRTPAVWVQIQAKSSNSVTAYVVGVTSAKAAGTNASGQEVIGGGIVNLPPCSDTNFYDLATIYVDVGVGGEGFKFLYGVR